jgi:hypothetical protein
MHVLERWVVLVGWFGLVVVPLELNKLHNSALFLYPYMNNELTQ